MTGYFFLLDQNRESGAGNTGRNVALVNDNRCVKIIDYILSFVPF